MSESTSSETSGTTPARLPIIVMGVQGCGKSTVGRGVADALGIRFQDGDDLHSAQARAKMASGHPLTDADRLPWLMHIAQTMATALERGEVLTVACSALKRSYRDLMRDLVPSLVFVELYGDQALIAERLTHRNHEYMPAALLHSQFTTLEPLAADETGIRVELTKTPNEIVAVVQNLIRNLNQEKLAR